jgi:ABC-type oligopeptide transport system substrate-binding subunit
LEEKLMRKSIAVLFALLIATSLVLASCAQPQVQEVVKTVVVTQVVEGEVVEVVVTEIVEVEVEVPAEAEEPMEEEIPVTLHWNYGTEPPTADPSLATDTTSVDVDTNLFVGLTMQDDARKLTKRAIPAL